MNQQFYKNLALWVVILVVMLLLFTTLKTNESPIPTIAYNSFMEEVETNQVEAVLIEEGNIEGKFTDGRKFKTYAPPASIDGEFLTKLDERNVETTVKPPGRGRVLATDPDHVVPARPVHRPVDLLHPPDAERRR